MNGCEGNVSAPLGEAGHRSSGTSPALTRVQLLPSNRWRYSPTARYPHLLRSLFFFFFIRATVALGKKACHWSFSLFPQFSLYPNFSFFPCPLPRSAGVFSSHAVISSSRWASPKRQLVNGQLPGSHGSLSFAMRVTQLDVIIFRECEHYHIYILYFYLKAKSYR